MSIWQILTGLLALPVTGQVMRWIHGLTNAKARARAKALDAVAKAEAMEKQQLADLHSEIRSHRITRDAEILALGIECAKLREDAQHDRELAQRLELQQVRDRGAIQRLTEQNDRLVRSLDDSRRVTRPSDPFRGDNNGE